jgi:type IV pilus assembly protein PilF
MWAKKYHRTLICLLPVILASCSLFKEPERKSDKEMGIYLQLGIRYLNLNNLPSAKENLELAAKIEEGNKQPVYVALAFLYEKLDKFDDARAEYERALKLEPEDLNVQNNFGRFLCDRREFDKGMALLTQASSNMLNQSSWMPLTNAGRCKMAMGDKAEAENFFGKALQANPSYAPALLEMQKLNYQNGAFKVAHDYQQRFASVSGLTPESLWISIQTENSLGNATAAKEYSQQLLDKFPFSNEAKQIKSTQRP